MEFDSFSSRSSQLENQLAAQWRPLSTEEVWRLLSGGLTEHLDKLDAGITQTWQAELIGIVSKWFEISKSEIDPKFLKKLTNATLAAGRQGFERICETLAEWPTFENFDQRRTKMDNVIVCTKRGDYRVTDDFAKTTKCFVCERSLGNDTYIIFKNTNSGNERKQHFICFVAESLRRKGSEYRNAKYGFYKQAKSARAILFAQRGKDHLRTNESLITFNDFVKWRDAMDADWQRSTTVKEPFHKSYMKNFHDYANMVLDAYFNPTSEPSSLRTKLDKHFEQSNFESVIDSYLNSKLSSSLPVQREYRDPITNRVADFQVGDVAIETKVITSASQFAHLNPYIERGTSIMMDLSKFKSDDKLSLVLVLLGLLKGKNLRIQKISDTTYFLAKPSVNMFGDSLPSKDSNSNEKDLSKFLTF